MTATPGLLPRARSRLARELVERLALLRYGAWPRPRPLSDDYGFDRGLPVDRHYIEAFLRRRAGDIRGRALEVKDDGYTRRFGGAAVTRCDVLDVDPRNARATIVADLEQPDALPVEAFDSVVLTQVLQYVDPPAALRHLWAALRPGGVLIVTAPTLSRLDPGGGDLWRVTPAGLERLLVAACPGAVVDVEGAGNVATCTAFLHGLAVSELRGELLDVHDPGFPLLALGRAAKPGAVSPGVVSPDRPVPAALTADAVPTASHRPTGGTWAGAGRP